MEIISTFTIQNRCLYSVLFDTVIGTLDDEGNPKPPEELHEFQRLFNFWNDAIALNDFFEQYEEDLQNPYWDGITIDEAITKTQKEAKKLKHILIEYAKNGKTKNLSMLFKPLSKGGYSSLEKDKVKASGPKTWIRLYAIRLDLNLFVVCGGAIKLRKTLNDRDYLLKELDKLEIAKQYLLDKEDHELELFELY